MHAGQDPSLPESKAHIPCEPENLYVKLEYKANPEEGRGNGWQETDLR